MTTERDVSSSDTLERSNLSSLQTDLSSAKKSSKLESSNVNLDKIQNCFHQQYANENDMDLFSCPVLNSNFNPDQYYRPCYCQQYGLNDARKQNDCEKRKNDWQHFNWKWPRRCYSNKAGRYSDSKLRNKRYFYNKQFACSERLDGIPRPKQMELRNLIENPMKLENYCKDEEELPEKIEIYYFDHGNSAYYHTTDMPPILSTEKFSEQAHSKCTRFWAELFGYVHIVLLIVTTFLLQFFRCILFSVVRPLTIGVVQLIADYFLKPLLSITFNGIIQPIFILLYNIATSFRDCCEPIATTLGFFLKELALLLRSCRIVEITQKNSKNNIDS